MSVTAPELETVSVDLGARSYDILVGHGALDQLGPRLAAMLKQKILPTPVDIIARAVRIKIKW